MHSFHCVHLKIIRCQKSVENPPAGPWPGYFLVIGLCVVGMKGQFSCDLLLLSYLDFLRFDEKV